MQIPSEMLIDVELNGLAAYLKPDIYQDGNTYCVIYGRDPQSGIFGSGFSVDEALEDWTEKLRKAMADDLEIKRILAQREPPEQVSKFLEKLHEHQKNDDTGYNLNKNY